MEERSVAVVVLLGLQYFLSASSYGRLIRAVADDKEAAQLAGADYRHVFGIAAALAFGTVALAGIAIALWSRRGLRGLVDEHLHVRLFPVGYWLWPGATTPRASRLLSRLRRAGP